MIFVWTRSFVCSYSTEDLHKFESFVEAGNILDLCVTEEWFSLFFFRVYVVKRGKQVDAKETLRFARLFKNDFTIDNLNRQQLEVLFIFIDREKE